MRLISIGNILPKGMYVENAVKVGGSSNSCAVLPYARLEHGKNNSVLCPSLHLLVY